MTTRGSEIRQTVLRVAAAELGPDSPLPQFTPLRALPPTVLGPGASPEMTERVGYGRLDSPLPYALQQDYSRTFEHRAVPAIELSNDRMRATVLPTYGGRVWSLYDVARDRELLYVNPVLAFANFGLTDAWFAGGIEWNLGSTGHVPHSNLPMHAAVVEGPDGPVLRLWEWERTRDLVLQVDLSLPPGSDRLYASTRVINPDPEEKPLYYWTNIAVPETPQTRVLAEATHAWRTDYGGVLTRVEVPHPDSPDVDISYPMAARRAADYFFEVDAAEGRHIVSVEPDGRGFAQTSTEALTGRKLFLWGSGAGGDRWQEWLSGPHARYAEIQAGRCPTQLEHDRLPGGSAISWTEAFGAVDLAPDVVAGEYAEAAAAARAAVHELVPPAALAAWHAAWLSSVADAAPIEALVPGSGWGTVELRLRGVEPEWLTALPFPEVDDESAAAAAWLAGDLAALDATADRLPVPPTSDRWRAVYDDGSEHWWGHLARAVAAQARGDDDLAATAYDASLAARVTPWALRGLATLATDPAEASELYSRARELAPDVRGLATEQLNLLLAADRPDEALKVLDELPDRIRQHGRTRLLEATALAAAGREDEARRLLDELVRGEWEVEDLAEGEPVIGDLWGRLHPDTAVPPAIEFRMTET